MYPRKGDSVTRPRGGLSQLSQGLKEGPSSWVRAVERRNTVSVCGGRKYETQTSTASTAQQQHSGRLLLVQLSEECSQVRQAHDVSPPSHITGMNTGSEGQSPNRSPHPSPSCLRLPVPHSTRPPPVVEVINICALDRGLSHLYASLGSEKLGRMPGFPASL